jgi:hypothetical protein
VCGSLSLQKRKYYLLHIFLPLFLSHLFLTFLDPQNKVWMWALMWEMEREKRKRRRLKKMEKIAV